MARGRIPGPTAARGGVAAFGPPPAGAANGLALGLACCDCFPPCCSPGGKPRLGGCGAARAHAPARCAPGCNDGNKGAHRGGVGAIVFSGLFCPMSGRRPVQTARPSPGGKRNTDGAPTQPGAPARRQCASCAHFWAYLFCLGLDGLAVRAALKLRCCASFCLGGSLFTCPLVPRPGPQTQAFWVVFWPPPPPAPPSCGGHGAAPR